MVIATALVSRLAFVTVLAVTLVAWLAFITQLSGRNVRRYPFLQFLHFQS